MILSYIAFSCAIKYTRSVKTSHHFLKDYNLHIFCWNWTIFCKYEGNILKRFQSSIKVKIFNYFSISIGKYFWCYKTFFIEMKNALWTSNIKLYDLLYNCNFIKKEALAQVFSCEFCKVSKNTFLTEHLWKTVSKICFHLVLSSIYLILRRIPPAPLKLIFKVYNILNLSFIENYLVQTTPNVLVTWDEVWTVFRPNFRRNILWYIHI